MRYINVTVIDSTGSATHVQIATPAAEKWGLAIEWMENKMATAVRAGCPLIAAFMYDTRSKQLLRYDIASDGMCARLR